MRAKAPRIFLKLWDRYPFFLLPTFARAFFALLHLQLRDTGAWEPNSRKCSGVFQKLVLQVCFLAKGGALGPWSHRHVYLKIPNGHVEFFCSRSMGSQAPSDLREDNELEGTYSWETPVANIQLGNSSSDYTAGKRQASQSTAGKLQEQGVYGWETPTKQANSWETPRASEYTAGKLHQASQYTAGKLQPS